MKGLTPTPPGGEGSLTTIIKRHFWGVLRHFFETFV